jgi:hypothetical protein
MEQVLEAAWRPVRAALSTQCMRLPWELDALFREWLELHAP